jgi:hypothetical protein
MSKTICRPSNQLWDHPGLSRERTRKEPLMPASLSPGLLEKNGLVLTRRKLLT